MKRASVGRVPSGRCTELCLWGKSGDLGDVWGGFMLGVSGFAIGIGVPSLLTPTALLLVGTCTEQW